MTCVYILGAGASAGYANGQRGISPPVARTFFQAVGRLLNGHDGLDQDRFSNLWAFLEHYYQVALGDLANCHLDIEEVLTLLDVGRAHRKERPQLLDLIALTLDKIIYGNPCKHHLRLVNSLGPEDVIITFNWDLLVDNVVAMNNDGGPDYGVNLLEPVQESHRAGANRRTSPLVLKPHGSMNWMTCRGCKKSYAYVLQGKTAAAYHAGQDVNCRACGKPTEPLMIPPTLMKSYTHPVIKAVWEEAARILRRADEIVIVGYSLPPTDFKAKWLFMETSADRGHALRSLTIVDQKPEPLKEKFRQAFHADERLTHVITDGIKDVPCHTRNA